MSSTATQKNEPAGHAAHTQDAKERGLPGVFQRPIKVAFIGAGSFFTPRVLWDILKTPGQQGGPLPSWISMPNASNSAPALCADS